MEVSIVQLYKVEQVVYLTVQNDKHLFIKIDDGNVNEYKNIEIETNSGQNNHSSLLISTIKTEMVVELELD